MADESSPAFNDGYARNLNTSCVTIAQVLKSAGYGTYATGKWHVALTLTKPTPDVLANWPLHRGFDRFYGTIYGAGSFFDPATLTRGDTFISPFADPEYRPPAGQPYYYTDAIGEHACRFIREHVAAHRDQPFFLYTAFTAAHWPMHAPPEYIAKYKGKYDAGYEPIRRARFENLRQMGLIARDWELSPAAENWAKVTDQAWEARCMEVYAAMLDRMDQNIGRIVRTLREQNQLDNTLILYLQDNGGNYEPVGRTRPPPATRPVVIERRSDEYIQLAVKPTQTRDGRPVRMGPGVMPGPDDTYIAYGKGWANVSNTPFREYKHFVHEGGIATPLIAHWPAGIKRANEFEKQPGHLIDLMTTFVELSGASYPARLDGHAITPAPGVGLVPAFAGKPLAERPIFFEHEGNRAVRLGKWKLVAKNPDGKWELYDMDADRTEMHDRSGTDPTRVAAMATQWEAWAKQTKVLPWPWEPAYRPAATPGQ
jgi:arylsulfatase